MKEVEERIIELFANIGIYINANNKSDEIIMNSLQFAYIIVELENLYNIELNDEITFDELASLISLGDYIEFVSCRISM